MLVNKSKDITYLPALHKHGSLIQKDLRINNQKELPRLKPAPYHPTSALVHSEKTKCTEISCWSAQRYIAPTLVNDQHGYPHRGFGRDPFGVSIAEPQEKRRGKKVNDMI